MVEEPGGFEAHDLGRVELGGGVRQGMGDGLVLPDGPVEDDPLLGVLDGALEGRAPDPHRLDADDDALGVQRIEQMVEALADGADHVLIRHLQVLDEDLVGVHRRASELVDQAHRHRRPVQIGEEERHALEGLLRITVAGPGQQQDLVGVLRVGGPDLAPVDDPPVLALDRARLDPRGVGAGIGLGHAERHHDVARRDPGEVLLLHLGRAVLDDRRGREDVEVDRRGARGPRPRGADLVEHE